MVQVISEQKDLDALIQSGKLVVVDFYADWCGPCKMIAPKVEELSKLDENKDVIFCKVNVDEAEEIAAKYGIEAMPTFLFFKNTQVDSFKGADIDKLKQFVGKYR